MLEPLGVAIHAMDLAKMKRVMETVAVIGCGPIGLCLLQLARMICQDKVFAVDPAGYRANLAKKLGADEVADSHKAIADWTNGRGVDLVLEATNCRWGSRSRRKRCGSAGGSCWSAFPMVTSTCR